LDDLAADLNVIAKADPNLARELSELRSLEHVLSWLPKKSIPLSSIDMVEQDEYCHDLTVPLGDGRVVNFGMT